MEYELKMAEQNRGPVTEEKVDALLAQEKQGAKNAGMNEAEYRLRTDWITGTAGAIWRKRLCQILSFKIRYKSDIPEGGKQHSFR